MSEKTSDQKSLGLSVYMGMAKYTSPLADRRGQRAISTGEEDASRIHERYGKPEILRAKGSLIWIHTADMGMVFSLVGLVERLAIHYPEAQFLVTTTKRVSEHILKARLPKTAVHQYAPYDTPRAVTAFLDHWQPDLCLWSENKLMPMLLQETAERSIPMLYLNAIQPSRSFARLRRVSAVASSVLNRFQMILATDEAASARFQKLGVDPEIVIVGGELSEGSAPLTVDDSVRAHVARQLHGRPVWLAAHVSIDEEDLVIRAHKIAQRSTHRLLTILSPLACAQIKGLEVKLKDSGLNIGCRSEPESLSPLTDILLADVPKELGLWYRIAPVSLIGSSLTKEGVGMNPGEPAALGSAIIHGPYVAHFADRFFKLAQAGAAVEVLNVESLAEAVSELIVPDKAAEMAHAAWVSNSDGAEVTDRVIDLVLEYLPPKGELA